MAHVPARLVGLALALGCASLLAIGIVGALARPSASSQLEVFWEAPQFGLIDQDGRHVGSQDLRGQVVVADFIYTSCRDICPLLSLRMQALQGRLQQEQLLGNGVQLLSFSVDPASDTPPVLKVYAARYRADSMNWRFLTGQEQEVIPLIVDGFHLGVQALPPPTPAADTVPGHEAHSQVMHSGRFLLIDRQWRVRELYDGTELDIDRVVRDVRQLIAG